MSTAKEPRVLLSKLVQAPVSAAEQGGPQNGSAAVYHLSPCDQLSVTTATARASFWQGARFDAEALERGLQAVLADLPFLAGRVSPMKGLKLSSVHIALTNQGALLTVADSPGVTMGDVGPDTWTMRGITLSNPDVPFYLERMDGGRVLKGMEPLMKVRLTRLAYGDVLGITLSHAITDGMRWPSFMVHFAARYRQVATGAEPAPGSLLHPVDRAALSSANLAAALADDGGITTQPLPTVSASLGNYWRAGSLLVRDSYKTKDLLILHVPKSTIQELKGRVIASSKNHAISSGDVIQALSGMLVNAATGRPLLPRAPRFQVVLVQLRGVHPQHFGNAVHLLPVQAPPGLPELPVDDYMATLAQLASLIRTATADFRAQPGASVQALAQLEQLVGTPVHRMLGWLAGHRLPNVACTTNYIGTLPADKDLDFGFGAGPCAMRWLVTPLGSDMAVIRPAMPPHAEGVFIHTTLTARQARRLKAHPLLHQAIPTARFLGGA